MQDRDYELKEVLDTFRRDGSMIREKSRVLVEDWLERLYPRMADPGIPTSALLEIGKTLIELGDLKPKKELAQTSQGPAFSITINIPQSDGKPPITIEGYATERDDEAPTTSESPDMQEMVAALPERTTQFTAPGFELDSDLAGVLSSGDSE